MEVIKESLAVFYKGGPVMYLILLCSLLVVTIGIERHLYYRQAEKGMDDFADRLALALADRDLEAAEKLCAQSAGIAAELAIKGLRCLKKDIYHLESVLEGQASLAVAGLKENLNHLSSIVTMAPLLGLLGTVIGMISSFSLLNVKAGQPMAITGGVGEALIATAAGLCVAIAAMVVYSYFTHRLDRIVSQLERICLILIEQVRREKNHEIA